MLTSLGLIRLPRRSIRSFMCSPHLLLPLLRLIFASFPFCLAKLLPTLCLYESPSKYLLRSFLTLFQMVSIIKLFQTIDRYCLLQLPSQVFTFEQMVKCQFVLLVANLIAAALLFMLTSGIDIAIPSGFCPREFALQFLRFVRVVFYIQTD